jgi:acyl carrier protein
MHLIEHKFSQIFKYMGLTQEQIRPEASFKSDFEFEEFQFICLAFYIGIYFKINVQEKDYAELDTIGNSINFVRRKLEQYNNEFAA